MTLAVEDAFGGLFSGFGDRRETGITHKMPDTGILKTNMQAG
jgi:hypothetical protein